VLAIGAWDQSKVWQDSETLWRWATGIDSQCSICWNNLGTSLTDQKRHAEAEAAYRRALSLRPNRASVVNNVATALYGQQKYAEAEEMLKVALRLDPGLTGALTNMGALKAQAGHYAEALTYFRRPMPATPDSPSSPGTSRWPSPTRGQNNRRPGAVWKPWRSTRRRWRYCPETSRHAASSTP